MDRDRSYLLNESVDNLPSEQRRFAARAIEGLEASRKGLALSHEEVGRMVDAWGAPEPLKAIGAMLALAPVLAARKLSKRRFRRVSFHQ